MSPRPQPLGSEIGTARCLRIGLGARWLRRRFDRNHHGGPRRSEIRSPGALGRSRKPLTGTVPTPTQAGAEAYF